MEYTRYVEFYNKNRKTLKITEAQYLALRKIINKDKFVEINGESYSTSGIEAFPKIKQEPLYLEAPPPKPISKTFLQKKMAEMAKRFNWNSQTN